MPLTHKVSWVSDARFAPYLEECGTVEEAWKLYELNAQIAAALSEVIHHTEVLLRNAMSDSLANAHPFDFGWNQDSFDISALSTKLAKKYKRPVTKDDIIAHLNMGYWASLLSTKSDANEEIWRKYLRNAFPGQGSRKIVAALLTDLNVLRNRCAHQDSLLNVDPTVELKKILRLASWIDQDARLWLENLERVTKLAAQRTPKLNTAILGHADDSLFTFYQRVGAVILEASTPLAKVDYIGFYFSQKIVGIFPKVLDIEIASSWNKKTSDALKKSSDPEEKRLGKIMSHALSDPFVKSYPPENTYKIYHLSGSKHPSTLTTAEKQDIVHEASGRGSAFVKRPRYFQSSSLLAARVTSDLPSPSK